MINAESTQEMALSMLHDSELTSAENVERLEADIIKLPQVECPVYHHFGPGIYIREVHIPAGAVAIGHRQKLDHMNIMLRGKVAVIDDDGGLKMLEAPLMFVGKPGRKVGYIFEDVIWQNVYATEETDIDKLEATYLDKSLTFTDHMDALESYEKASREIDRDDYRKVIASVGMTEKQVRDEVENEDDQIPMPEGYGNIGVRDSAIEGKGVFVSAPVSAGDIIGPGRIDGRRTPIGRYTNHSATPNAEFINDGSVIYLVATHDIKGCEGGSKGEEITVDYRQALIAGGVS